MKILLVTAALLALATADACARANPGNGDHNNGLQGTGNPNAGNNGNSGTNGNAQGGDRSGDRGGGKGGGEKGGGETPAPSTPGPSAPAAGPATDPGRGSSAGDGSGADARGSYRLFCDRWPTDFWCQAGPPHVAPPKR